MLPQKITVTLNGERPYVPLIMRQGDSGRAVQATIIDANGNAYSLAGATALFQADKPDGTKVSYNGVQVAGNVATFQLPKNVLAAYGTIFCEFVFTQNTEDIGTVKFTIDCQKAAVTDADMKSSDEFQSAQEAANAAQGYANNAHNSAESAAESAAEAQRIKDSTEMLYDVQETRVGFKRKDENIFTYTGDLTGPQGPRGLSGDGSGDMLAEIYDPGNMQQNIYEYAAQVAQAAADAKFPKGTQDLDSEGLNRADLPTGFYSSNSRTAGNPDTSHTYSVINLYSSAGNRKTQLAIKQYPPLLIMARVKIDTSETEWEQVYPIDHKADLLATYTRSITVSAADTNGYRAASTIVYMPQGIKYEEGMLATVLAQTASGAWVQLNAYNAGVGWYFIAGQTANSVSNGFNIRVGLSDSLWGAGTFALRVVFNQVSTEIYN